MDARDYFGYKNPDEEPGGPDPAEDEDDDETRPPLFEEAVTLDDPATRTRIDPDDMLGRVADLPRQLAEARRVAAPVTLSERHTDVDAVVVLAMGGSAIGAELVAAAAGDRLKVPLIVHRDYGLPPGIGARTLVIAASHSGETAETLSGFAAARQRDLPLAVITTGGRLAAGAAEAGLPLLQYRLAGQPRAAIGFGVGLVHELLSRAGLVSDPDPVGPVVGRAGGAARADRPIGRDRRQPDQAARLGDLRPAPGDLRPWPDGRRGASVEDAAERERQGVGVMGADAGGEPQRHRGQHQSP